MVGQTTVRDFTGPGGFGLTVTSRTGGAENVGPSTYADAIRRNQPQSPGFDADAYVADMNYATLNNLLLNGANLPGVGDRSAATAAAKRRMAELNPTQVPTGQGMGPGGYQQGVTPNPDFDPGIATGVNDIPVPDTVVDYGPGSPNDVVGPRPPATPDWAVPPVNGMEPDGSQIGVNPPAPGGGDGAGGGAPGQPLGNWGQFQDFYQNQFEGLLGQSNRTANAQRAAAIRRQNQQGQTQEPFTPDWDWANLPEVQVQGPGDGTWAFSEGLDITPGQTTNREILNQLNLDPESMQWINAHWRDYPEQADSVFWSTRSGPGQFPGAGDEPSNRFFRALEAALYQQGGTIPGNIPEGYAAPLSART